jgi:hypothetical protein
VLNNGSSLSPLTPGGRLWVCSSTKLCSRVVEWISVVVFEKGSRPAEIEGSAFHGSGLRSIEMPSSVVVLGKSSFRECPSLESVTF